MAKIHNLAFDYSNYDREVKREDEKNIRFKLNKAFKNKGSMITFVGLAIVIMSMFLAMATGESQLAGLYEKQSEQQTELAALIDDNATMKAEIETKTSLGKVEDYAENKLGLKKLDKSQIEYVEVPKENVVEVVKTEDEGLAVKIKNWFSNALEYIGAK